MPASFTGKEFIDALKKDTLKEPIIKDGMVKQDEKDSTVILFTEGASCDIWTKVPVDLIEKVDHMGTIRCRDHQHPFVRLHFKAPGNNPVAAVFAELLKRSGAQSGAS